MNKYNLKELEEKLERCRNANIDGVKLEYVDEISSIKIDRRKSSNERILEKIQEQLRWIMKKLSFIGIGGSTNIELGGNCCYLKEKDNLLIIDMGEGATEKLEKAGAFKGIKNIYIVITHTHFDHVAGLGVFIWYCNFDLNISPKIIYSNFKYMHTLKKLLKLTGVDKKFVKYIRDSSFKINDLKLSMQKTTHTPKLQCFGIMFQDKLGKYYYTGDTNDINYIKKLCEDKTIKIIYTEIATETYDAHIKYDDIINLEKEKLILMHFDTMELYKKAIKDGFEVACIEGSDINGQSTK